MTEPFLVGDLVYLRPLRYEDLDGNYVHWLNDPEVCRYNRHHVLPYTREQGEEYIRHARSTKDELILAIVVKETEQHIGNIALTNIDRYNQRAEYTVLIGEPATGKKGYAKEAAVLLFRHGFFDLNLRRIYGAALEDHTMANIAAPLLGMKQEGILREAIFCNGKFNNLIYYGILKDEFIERYEKITTPIA
ncbi:MAG: GNAT family N-acetyltransferase [Planctomycetaceae bacterium]|jgi:RimJ/RimL family protein N-acetyltransferase|nr:GNAT family N-acetyltransferase [Planctomycetaceae bacterium]